MTLNPERLQKEDEAIRDILLSARQIQEFLWSGINSEVGFQEFRRMFRKRVIKLDEVSFDNPYWKVEARKRLLQVAAIAVNVLAKLDEADFVGTNLPQFSDNLKRED